MGDTLIRVENLSFAYPDGAQALNGVSFSVAAGEKVALAGPNGAGKSTLLLVLCGLMDGGFAGAVEIAGLPVRKSNLGAIRRTLGLVFQNPDDQLFCATVFDDVAFGPRNMKLPEEEVGRRVKAALCSVGLAGFEQRSPIHLSLGEKRRAAIATVLAMNPALLVLDEPTSMLDGRGRREIVQLLHALGSTQLIVTHDLDVIARSCERMVILSAGRVVADAPTRQLLATRRLLEEHGLV